MVMLSLMDFFRYWSILLSDRASKKEGTFSFTRGIFILKKSSGNSPTTTFNVLV